jgi:hypothetical protein
MGLVLKVLERMWPEYVKYERLIKIIVEVIFFAVIVSFFFIIRPEVVYVCNGIVMNSSVFNSTFNLTYINVSNITICT